MDWICSHQCSGNILSWKKSLLSCGLVKRRKSINSFVIFFPYRNAADTPMKYMFMSLKMLQFFLGFTNIYIYTWYIKVKDSFPSIHITHTHTAQALLFSLSLSYSPCLMVSCPSSPVKSIFSLCSTSFPTTCQQLASCVSVTTILLLLLRLLLPILLRGEEDKRKYQGKTKSTSYNACTMIPRHQKMYYY